MIRGHNISRLISARALASPHALALASGCEAISYLELEARSNQLAGCLHEMSVGREQPVGLFLGRSPAAVIGALGILKAGAAYVPLEPAYPANRLAFLLADANIQTIVSDRHVAAKLPDAGSRTTLLADDPHLAALPATRPPVEIGPDQLAYVMYTSGSTGAPKGVAVTHANVLNLIDWHNEAFQITAQDRASQVASFGFDAAVWEIWPHLAAGASLHFAAEDIRTEPESLRDWLIEQAITVSFVPTALAEHMLALPWPATTSLRYLLTGADTLRVGPSAALPFVVVNNYGPTECTVVATSGSLLVAGTAAGNHHRLPPIGRPIRNTKIYIVDENLRPAPDGEAGELLIGGAGLARGYLNRPELTAQRFIRDPFSNDPGARLYRTGDLGRYLPDGQIAFLGRLDDQIKIRGYRIEPEEIAAALRKHPGVRSAIVKDWADEHGGKQLVAWVIAQDQQADPADLRTFLRTQLPEYMVPAHFVAVESFPITTNGKLDYAALPAPDGPSSGTAGNGTAALAASAVETRLTGILVDLLGVAEVRRDDNFFLLGGHSLLGAQMIARIREVFGVQLTLRKLFHSPTLAALTVAIEASQQAVAAAK